MSHQKNHPAHVLRFRPSHLSTFVALTLLGPAPAFAGAGGERRHEEHHVDRVLLISVDGLHALDMARFTEIHPRSALARLAGHGVSFTNARPPANSDSFPGLLALVTGGSPISHGVFYDVSYDRTLFDPTNTGCVGPAGNTVVLDESIDLYDASNVSRDVLDPSKLPRRLDAHGACVPVYPHEFVRSNTLFEVVREA